MVSFLQTKLMSVWNRRHRDDPIDTEYDPMQMEEFTAEELTPLMRYVHGERPRWGRRVEWWSVDQVK